jgi:hypothetical protein
MHHNKHAGAAETVAMDAPQKPFSAGAKFHADWFSSIAEWCGSTVIVDSGNNDAGSDACKAQPACVEG